MIELDRVALQDLKGTDFFSRYVAKRQPVILTGWSDDLKTVREQWTSFAYLRSKAGEATVHVERFHPTQQQYGTCLQREVMTFGDFLHALEEEKPEEGYYPYLTTQYHLAEEEEEEDPFPQPIRSLLRDIPLVPAVTYHLALQQINLWMGRAPLLKESTSSGLHHDYHDNLYCLVKGAKRFLLFPPEAAFHVRPFGTVSKIHENGLIVYKEVGVEIRDDGISEEEAQRIHRLCEEKTRTKVRDEEEEVDESEEEEEDEGFLGLPDAEANMSDEEADFDFDFEGEDDFDLLEQGLAEESEEEESAQRKKRKVEPAEPLSFSQIKAADLHAHLGLVTKGSTVSKKEKKEITKALDAAGEPFVAHLEEGEMLYLPAGWWHEVSSYAPSAKKEEDDEGKHVHMALNYWFHPPTKVATAKCPYEDAAVAWYRQSEAKKMYEKITQ